MIDAMHVVCQMAGIWRGNALARKNLSDRLAMQACVGD